MLNLVRFRDKAAYPPDHPLAGQGLSGAEAYAHYGRDSGPVFQRLGGRIVWRGTMEAMVIGPEAETWDAVFVAEYPNSGALMAMVTAPDYREDVVHRQSEVEPARFLRRAPGSAAPDGFGCGITHFPYGRR